jgi:hypothetical protein
MRNSTHNPIRTGLAGACFSAALLVGLLGAAGGSAAADMIHLLDGNAAVEGRIIREDARGITLAVEGGGEVCVARSRILKVERESRDRSAERRAEAIEAFAAALALDAALAPEGAEPRPDALDPVRVDDAVARATSRLLEAPLNDAASVLERLGGARIPALLPAIEQVARRAGTYKADHPARARVERAVSTLLAPYFEGAKEPPSAAAVDAQAALLLASDASVREAAALRLGATDDPIAVLRLIEASFADAEDSVRGAAWRALVAIAGKDVGPLDAWRGWWSERVKAGIRRA